MRQNPFTFLDQAISQLLVTNIPTLEATGLDIFRGLAVILIGLEPTTLRLTAEG